MTCLPCSTNFSWKNGVDFHPSVLLCLYHEVKRTHFGGIIVSFMKNGQNATKKEHVKKAKLATFVH